MTTVSDGTIRCLCPACKGGGFCPVCNGQGHIPSKEWHSYLQREFWASPIGHIVVALGGLAVGWILALIVMGGMR